MKTQSGKLLALALLALLSNINCPLSTALAQGTAFTYQGRLNDGVNPANGIYDLRFTIYDAVTNGTQQGGFVTNSATVVSNGLFTVTLDFGNQFPGAGRWLEIGARTNGAAAFVTLAPRQALTVTPYSIQSANAASATSAQSVQAGNIVGTLNAGQLPSGIVTNGSSGVSISGAFTGNGSGLTNVPGTTPWQAVAGTNVTAAANQGYLLTNSGTTTVTLPTTANVGDIVTVSGDGSNGWEVLAAPGQLIGEDSATNWTDNNDAPPASWQALASSADGTKLVAVINGGQIYTSIDSGLNWFAANATSDLIWSSVASSADGTKLVAGTANFGIFTSTNSGASWSANNNAPAFEQEWRGLASSADGTKLVAAEVRSSRGIFAGPIYTSMDSGATWTRSTNAGATLWTAVASSSDGNSLVAVSATGQISTSADSGNTWSTNNNFPSASWTSVASSSDGSKLVAVAPGSPIFTSTNSGATWSTNNNSPSANWASVASSVDGTKLVAVTSGGGIYTSPDSGVTWSTNNDAPAAGWQSVASSADGGKLVAAVSGGQLWTSDAGFSGTAGTTAQFQYVGNGVWLPVGVPASQISGTLPPTDLPPNVVINGETGVALSGIFSGSFSGDGSGLTGLNASQLTSGTVPSAALAGSYSSALTLSNAANAFTGSFSGNGSGLTSLSASQLTTGTVPSAALAGTYSSALTLNNAVNAFTGSFTGNGSGLTGVALLSGGNTFTNDQIITNGSLYSYGTVSAVVIRPASTNYAAVTEYDGTNDSSGFRAFVGADGIGITGTAGQMYVGTYSANPVIFYTGDQPRMLIDTSGNVGIGISSPTNKLHVIGGATFSSGLAGANQNVVWIPGNASWSFTSDRNTKDHIAAVDILSVLEKVTHIPINEWSYIGYDQKHIGPMAQDFHAQFPLNESDTSLNDADLHGVALAAIQGLNEKVEAENQKLEAEDADLKARLEKLERLINSEGTNHSMRR